MTEEEEDIEGCVTDCVGDTLTVAEKKETLLSCIKRWAVKIIRYCFKSHPRAPAQSS
jgi:hypothetical protein